MDRPSPKKKLFAFWMECDESLMYNVNHDHRQEGIYTMQSGSTHKKMLLQMADDIICGLRDDAP
jgi:hypothetical protein